MPNVLFIINGLGLGNSTRCHAIIQRLLRHGAKISIVTSGNGLWYFNGKDGIDEMFELKSLKYGARDGQISIANTLASTMGMLRILKENGQTLNGILDRKKPNVVVSDSDYVFLPMKRRGIPTAALNNADVIYHSYRRFPDRPASIRPQFYCVEVLDYLFHCAVSNRVLSPSLDPTIPGGAGNIKRIGPIVREGYDSAPRSSVSSRVVIMLSGSVFGSPVRLSRESYPFEIDVLGREAPAGVGDSLGIRYHGKVKETAEFLKAADLLIINGGFSAVSEAYCMRKPMVVVPVPRHAEQWVNAKTVEQLGVGMVGAEDTLEEAMLEAFDRVPEFRFGYERIGDIPDGAAEAAEAILEMAGAA